jgi:hypothetical protein
VVVVSQDAGGHVPWVPRTYRGRHLTMQCNRPYCRKGPPFLPGAVKKVDVSVPASNIKHQVQCRR